MVMNRSRTHVTLCGALSTNVRWFGIRVLGSNGEGGF